MSDGRINGLDLKAAIYNGKNVLEIAVKDENGQVARWRPDEYQYPGTLIPLFKTDFSDRSNGNLADGYDFVHHQTTSGFNQVIDGELHGPSSSYAMDIINHRLTGYSTYMRAKIKTPTEPAPSGNTRLQIRGGGRPSTSGEGYQWISNAHRLGTGANAGRLILYSTVFRQGWTPTPSVAPLENVYISALNEYRPNDEIAVFLRGREIQWFYNGRRINNVKTLADDQWTPGYFSSIILDAGHIIDELEIGHWDFEEWNQLGDEFNVSDETVLWNRNSYTVSVKNGVVQSNQDSVLFSGVYYAYGFSKEPIHSPDQIIRATIREPVGVTMGSNVGVMVLGRASGGAPFGPDAQVGFRVTPSDGVDIVTVVGESITVRSSVTAANAGLPPFWPLEIELQCIGNRYHGLVNGEPLVTWVDTTGIVPIDNDHRYYGWATAFRRNNLTYTFSPAIDDIKGLTHSEMPSHKEPSILALDKTKFSLGGGDVSAVGQGLLALTDVSVGGTPATTHMPIFSDNSITFTFPPKGEGTYDVVANTPNGPIVLWEGVTYSALKRIFKDFSDLPNGPLPEGWASRLVSGITAALPVISDGSISAATTTTLNTQSRSITRWHETVMGDDQYVSARTTTGLDGLPCGVCLRLDDSMENGVMGVTTTSSDRGIWSIVDGVGVRRTSFTISHAVGDTWALSAEGNVYTMYRNGVSITTWTDTSGLIETGPEYRHGGLFVSSDRNLFGMTNLSAAWNEFDFRDLAWEP